MSIMLWTISSLLIALSIYLVVMNGMVFLNNYVFKKQWVSAIPIIGGISGAVGLALVPIHDIWRFAFIPLIIDWGCLPVVLVSLFLKLFGRNLQEKNREN